MTRDEAKKVYDEAEALLTALAAKHGFQLDRGVGGTFGIDELNLRARFTSAVSPEQKEEKRKRDFEFNCFHYGVDKKHYRATLLYGGKRYLLVGFNTRKPKYCVMAEDVATGKVWGLPELALGKLQKKGFRDLDDEAWKAEGKAS
jgi:hypothetical protein